MSWDRFGTVVCRLLPCFPSFSMYVGDLVVVGAKSENEA